MPKELTPFTIKENLNHYKEADHALAPLLEKAFNQTLEIITSKEGQIGIRVLPSIRRVMRIYSHPPSIVKHIEDIRFDLNSFEEENLTTNEIFQGIQAINGLALAYYNAGAQRATMVAARAGVDESFATSAAQEAIDTFIWKHWKRQGGDSSSIALGIFAPIRKRFRILDKIINRYAFYERERRISPSEKEKTIHYEGVDIEKIEMFDEVRKLSTSTYDILICLGLGYSEEELGKRLRVGPSEIYAAKQAYESILDRYGFLFSESRKKPYRYEDARDIMENIFVITEKLSLRQLFYLIEKLNRREKGAILVRLGYLEKYDYGLLHGKIFSHDLARARDKFYDLTSERLSRNATPTLSVKEIVNSVKRVWKMNGIVLHFDSPRIRLVESGAPNDEVLLSNLTEKEKIVLALATQVQNENFVYSNSNIASQVGLTPKYVGEYITNIDRLRISLEKGK